MDRRRFFVEGLKASAFLLGAAEAGIESAYGAGLTQAASGTTQARRQPQRIIESESGDPDLAPEVLKIEKAPIDLLYVGPPSRGIRKDPQTFTQTTLQVAKSYVGVNRANQPDQVEKYLNLFGLHIRYSDGVFVPYCASGLAFAACQAYCTIVPEDEFDLRNPTEKFKRILRDINKYYFKPSPACRIMVRDAKIRGTFLPRTRASIDKIKPGWVVFFDWKSIGVANHVAIVDQAENDVLRTVEFNTSGTEAGSQSNGGAVARRERQYRHVLGYIKTY